MQSLHLGIILISHRSSRSQMFFKIGVLKKFAIFTGKHLSLFLTMLQTKRSACLLKRDSYAGVFLWIFRIFKNAFFIEHLRWLLLFTQVGKQLYWREHWFLAILVTNPSRTMLNICAASEKLHRKVTVPSCQENWYIKVSINSLEKILKGSCF